MLLPNGSLIKQDVIDSFNKAYGNSENLNSDGTVNWNFVDADMNIDLGGVYSSEYLYECFEVLASAEERV